MKIRHSLLAVLAFTIATPVFAFDMPPPVEAPEYTGTISGVGGWYIRGDLGYNASLDGDDVEISKYRARDNSYETIEFDSSRLDSDFVMSGGAGYQFNDYFRTDFTLDYFTADFDASSTQNSRCSPRQLNNTSCAYRYKTDLQTLSLLANGYVDLGTVWGLTPYVGAGAGVANVDWNNMKTIKNCVGNLCDDSIDYQDKKSSGLESWRFTYALMAGVSYDIAAHTKLDLGYRYADIAGGDMSDFPGSAKRKGANNPQGTDNGFGRHEFRAGLRLTTW